MPIQLDESLWTSNELDTNGAKVKDGNSDPVEVFNTDMKKVLEDMYAQQIKD